jgi:hypothetical protein
MTTKNIKIDTTGAVKMSEDIIKKLGKVSKEEKGETVANIAISYIKIMNELNSEYIERLKRTLSLLKDLDNEKRSVGEEIRLEKIRADLNA